jgi:hypothetical protein
MPISSRLPYGQTVTLVKRTLAGQDSRGNNVYSESSQVIDGCAVSYGASAEIVQGTDVVASDVTVQFPDGTVVTAYDAMILPDGNKYEIEGTPNQDTSPFTGITSYVEVRGRVVTGSSV